VEKLSFSAVLLAGGDSKRMGTNKAFLALEGRNLVDIVFEKLDSLFKEVIVVTDRLDEFAYLPARLTTDLVNEGDKNALRGIQAGLTLSSYSSSFVIACDMPFLALPLIHYMSRFAGEFDIVVPRVGHYYQPLFAFYNKTTLEVINRQLGDKKLKIVAFYSGLHLKEIGEDIVRFFDPHMLSFYNINTKEEFLMAKKFLTPGNLLHFKYI
jgi:molybdopterin-guanine dinucleotide biosynthesis protein A